MNKLFDLTFDNLFFVDVWYEDDEDCITVYKGIVKFDDIEKLKTYFNNCYHNTGYEIDIYKLCVDEQPIDGMRFEIENENRD